MTMEDAPREKVSESVVFKYKPNRKRSYRACLYCRSRKAKCEMPQVEGVVINANEIKCARCIQDKQKCVFAESRRGGRANIEKGRQRRMANRINPRLPKNSEATAFKGTNQKDTSPIPVVVEKPSDTPMNFSPEYATDQLPDELTNYHGINSAAAAPSPPPQAPATRNYDSTVAPVDSLLNCELIKRKIVDPSQLRILLYSFFARHHHYMPVLPSNRVPDSDAKILEFALKEPILLVAFVVIASRYDSPQIHAASWAYMKEIISGLVTGEVKPTIGAVEAILLLSDNIPLVDAETTGESIRIVQERLTWQFIGLAISIGYYLGLDQKTLLFPDENMDEYTHRMRLVWTYSYIHDRQASIRLGLPFRNRGAAICFFSTTLRTIISRGGMADFPTLIPSPESPDDFASLMEAHVELTDILSNIHETLYPNRDRTIALVRAGEYQQTLDEFTRTFYAFQSTWKNKQWTRFPLYETVWLTYYFAKLYAYSFAFQAQLKRASLAREHAAEKGTSVPDVEIARSVFPHGVAASPDTKFILECQDAACNILRICVNQLKEGGVLPYMPARYYSYFLFAAVMLIKIVFTEAISVDRQHGIMKLVKQTIRCFEQKGRLIDERHTLVFCAQQLRVMIETLWPMGVTFSLDSVAQTPYARPQDEQQPKARTDSFTNEWPINNSPTELSGDISGTEQTMEHYDYENALDALTALLESSFDSDVWLWYFDSAQVEPVDDTNELHFQKGS
ncbi:hypothetical protein TRVA0_005S02432 [Trichomonascus vanleenenianus]|uniref:uncharacterized protein n=1 Tax=Trichomonascus vanleenenianus TaxID=2268995 RepID=UPI003EC95D9E